MHQPGCEIAAIAGIRRYQRILPLVEFIQAPLRSGGMQMRHSLLRQSDHALRHNHRQPFYYTAFLLGQTARLQPENAAGKRAIDRRFKCSRLQAQPSIDAFHFHHHKSRQQAKPRILRLLDLSFLAKGTNLVLIGNPGVGKTFLAKLIAWRACQINQRVLFTTAMDMLNHLLASHVDHSLVRKLKTYTEPTLLVCDELGYLALDQQTSNLFYQVISTRHSQKRSSIITTNTPFSDWGNILFNTTIATAIADRLVENSEIFLLGGDSLRKPNKTPNPPAEES